MCTIYTVVYYLYIIKKKKKKAFQWRFAVLMYAKKNCLKFGKILITLTVFVGVYNNRIGLTRVLLNYTNCTEITIFAVYLLDAFYT